MDLLGLMLMPDLNGQKSSGELTTQLLTQCKAIREASRPVIIVVTGGIGAGKSAFCSQLAQYEGVVHLDADLIGHRLLRENAPLINEISKRFGSGVVSEKGVNRSKLAEIVFNDPQELQSLEQLIHPPIMKSLATEVQSLKEREQIAIVLAEIPLLVRTGSPSWCDLIITIETTYQRRLTRLRQRGISEEQAIQRISQQAGDDRRREMADLVISNDGPLDCLIASAHRIWKQIIEVGGGSE